MNKCRMAPANSASATFRLDSAQPFASNTAATGMVGLCVVEALGGKQAKSTTHHNPPSDPTNNFGDLNGKQHRVHNWLAL